MGSSTKRKSPEDGTSQSKKKKSGEGKTSKLIQVGSVTRPKYAPPIIAASSGIDITHSKSSIKFQAYTKSETSSAKRRKNDGGGAPQDMLLNSVSHPSMDYTACEDRLASVSEPMLNHYIGIFDPTTNSVEIIEAKKMVLRGSARRARASDEAMAERTTAQNMRDKKNELGVVFGTKKAKQAIKSIAENAFTISEEIGAEDHAVMSSINKASKSMATADDLQAAVDQARPVPKGNYDADEIYDVYVPAEIIGKDVLKAIPVLEWQEKVNAMEAIAVPSRFVANRVNRVAVNENAVERLKVLRYLCWLLIFWGATGPGKARGTLSIGKKEKLRELMAPAPEVVIENIRRKFSDGGVMRKQHIDLLMTHCCVFAIIIDNFEVNTFDLREDLNLEQKQLNQYFMEIGARLKKTKTGDNIEHIAKLALPLQFPRIRMPAKRR